MKTPPFLLLAALLFWGWQSGLLFVGAILGVILEGARWIAARWDLDDADFNRIWTFCVVLNVALAGYVFTTNTPGSWSAMIHGHAGAQAANASVLTATRFLRWLPMTTFALMAAQVFNVRPTVPFTAVSLVLRWRQRKGNQEFAGHYLDVAYPYFMVCLFSAGIHPNTGTQTYFWGVCALAAWALWPLRSRRRGIFVWLAALALAIGLGFLGERGINQAQRAIQNFNAQWLARLFGQRTDPLQSMTSMGRIGRLKLSANIVVWLKPQQLGQVPTYLREASYRDFGPRSLTWYAGGALNGFENIPPEPDNSTWVLVPGRHDPASVNVTCYLNGRSPDGDPQDVLPLPSGCSRLENLPAFSSVIALEKNRNGTVLAIGSGLMIFDARFGLGATLDSPPDARSTNHYDLVVPTNEIPALQQVISEMRLSADDSEATKLEAVKRFFFDKFTYSLRQGEDKKATATASPLKRFLLTSRSGHCEYFATATVLLLRELNIPARYAVGYYVHEPRGSGYVVRERDAHAWCLAWNAAEKRWEDFDTTPPSWVAVEDRRTAAWEWLADFKSWLGLQVAKFRWRQAHLQQYILWSLVPVLVVLLYHILFRRRKRKRPAPKESPGKPVLWPGLDSEFYQLEKQLAARGAPRQPGEPLGDWLERALARPALAELRKPLRELLRLHYRHRFDPRGLNDPDREALKQKALALLGKISSASS